jgi:hypothetical protein
MTFRDRLNREGTAAETAAGRESDGALFIAAD